MYVYIGICIVGMCLVFGITWLKLTSIKMRETAVNVPALRLYFNGMEAFDGNTISLLQF